MCREPRSRLITLILGIILFVSCLCATLLIPLPGDSYSCPISSSVTCEKCTHSMFNISTAFIEERTLACANTAGTVGDLTVPVDLLSSLAATPSTTNTTTANRSSVLDAVHPDSVGGRRLEGAAGRRLAPLQNTTTNSTTTTATSTVEVTTVPIPTTNTATIAPLVASGAYVVCCCVDKADDVPVEVQIRCPLWQIDLSWPVQLTYYGACLGGMLLVILIILQGCFWGGCVQQKRYLSFKKEILGDANEAEGVGGGDRV